MAKLNTYEVVLVYWVHAESQGQAEEEILRSYGLGHVKMDTRQLFRLPDGSRGIICAHDSDPYVSW